ncbi:hypothetical protein ELL62_08340 [Campylobacter coli]|nr:hypothetical protein [Campylobacter coli]
MRPRSKKDQKKKALPLNKSLNLAFSQKLNSFRLSHYNKRALRFFAPKKRKEALQCNVRHEIAKI